jgi:hypothetical protein
MAMGQILQAAAGRTNPAAMAAPPGPLPPQEGLPPPPSGVGAIPTGDPGTTAKGAADTAILGLRECVGHYPSLAPVIQATIDAIKAAAQTKGGPPKAGLGQPSPPGTPPPVVPASGASGSPGMI